MMMAIATELLRCVVEKCPQHTQRTQMGAVASNLCFYCNRIAWLNSDCMPVNRQHRTSASMKTRQKLRVSSP